MKTLLNDLVGKSKQFDCLDSFDSSLYGFELKRPVKAELLVKQQGKDKYLLSGSLQASVGTVCDRCGNAMVLPIARDFSYTLRIGEEPEYHAEHESSDEECQTLYLEEVAVDCETLLAEQLLLSIPLQRLCNVSCQGLCKDCGINLNEKNCQCGDVNSNSPFAILKSLQQK